MPANKKTIKSLLIGILFLIGLILLLNEISYRNELFFDFYTHYCYKPIQWIRSVFWENVVINLAILFMYFYCWY